MKIVESLTGIENNQIVPDLFLMRHGQTTANVTGRPQDADDRLTEHGEQQVRRSTANLVRLIGQGAIVLDRPLVVHHGPLARQRHSWQLAAEVLKASGIQVAIVQERPELAERVIDPLLADVSGYDATYRSNGSTHETWYLLRNRLLPYLHEIEDEYKARQLVCLSSGGTLGMLKLLMEFGIDGTLEILNRDAAEGAKDHDPRSSQWYLNKVPNAAIDACVHRPNGTWQTELRIMPFAA